MPAHSTTHLLTLGHELQGLGYRFVTPTPATIKRVNARHAGELAQDPAAVFGWGRAFAHDGPAGRWLDLLRALGLAEPCQGGGWRTSLRAATVDDMLLFHTSGPGAAADAVFLGPDTYRFLRALDTELASAVPRALAVGSAASGTIASAVRLPSASAPAANPPNASAPASNAPNASAPAATAPAVPLPSASAPAANPPNASAPATTGPAAPIAPPHAAHPRILDLGCGASAAALALARRYPQAAVLATDLNPAALDLATANATLAGLSSVTTQLSDLYSTIDGQFDPIVTNPPFIADPDQRTYRDGGGALGLDLSLRIVRESIPRLVPGGALMLYTGVAIVRGEDRFAQQALPLLRQAGMTTTYTELDPDIFGELLATPAYAEADRIAAVWLVARRAPCGHEPAPV